MTDYDSLGNHLSKKRDENIEKSLSAPEEKQESVLFGDEDIFIKKIFETDPRKAFELLFKKYYSVLCNHAVRFVYSKQKAEDLVADIFLSFWNSKLYANIRGSYRAYFFSAVRNKCITYLKWELKKQIADELNDTQLISFQASPEEILQASDLHIKIERTIKSMPVRQQQVFVMSRFEAKKNNIIATELNLSIKTVEMHISKALATLRKTISNES
jgi:RNA polymerase sigma-70 factor (ECF subfamily)